MRIFLKTIFVIASVLAVSFCAGYCLGQDSPEIHGETNTSEVILIALQLLVGIVLMGGIPWAFKVQAKLSEIAARLTTWEIQKQDSHEVHKELFERVRNVERSIDQCASCQQRELSAEA